MKISYERLCHIFGFLPIDLKNKKLKNAIDFCELNITTRQVYSTAIAFPLFLIFIGIIATIVVPPLIIFVYILLCLFLGYYLYRYVISLQKSLALQLTSETVTAVIYMATSLRETPNLERAVDFAASNLSGPLGKDLKKIMWDVYEGKYTSVDEALAKYAMKWKNINDDFATALNLLRNYTKKGALEEAVSLVTSGARTRTKDYALELRNPVRLVDALGFTFPLLALTLAPMILMIIQASGSAETLVSIYVIFLPLILFWLIKITLEKRPWTFPIIDISDHPDAIPERKIKIFGFTLPVLPIAILVGITVAIPGIINLFSLREFHFMNSIYTLPIVWAITLSFCIYLYSYKHNLKVMEEVKKTETEFITAIYALGDRLATGVPLESALEKTAKSLSGLSIAHFFEKTIYNIKTFGMTLERAIFDPDIGSIKYYPSKMVKCIMKILSDAVKKSLVSASKVAIWVHEHLKLMHATEQDVKDVVDEATSAMRIECYALAPFTCAIIVAFASLVMHIMGVIGVLLKIFTGQLTGISGVLTTGVLAMFANINKIIPPEYFQIVVGIYLIEIIYLLSMFQSKLENGENKCAQNVLTAKYLFISTFIYTITLIFTLQLFNALLPLAKLGGII